MSDGDLVISESSRFSIVDWTTSEVGTVDLVGVEHTTAEEDMDSTAEASFTASVGRHVEVVATADVELETLEAAVGGSDRLAVRSAVEVASVTGGLRVL